MSIEFRCSQCGTLLRTADETAGKQAKCPTCGLIQPIPAVALESTRGIQDRTSGSPFAPPAQPVSSPNYGPENPYQSPTSSGPTPSAWGVPVGPWGLQAASRLARLGGRLIDGVVQSLSLVPGFVLLIVSDSNQANGRDLLPLAGLLLLVVIGLGVSVFQWYLIASCGQSLGKKVVGTRIIRLDSPGPPGFVHGVLLRHWLPGILSSMPCGMGGIFFLVDACWIFGEESRCVHDLMANTAVVAVH